MAQLEGRNVLSYPEAPREPVVDTLFGASVADPYRWLEDPRNDRTILWSAHQDALFAAHAATWSGRAVVSSMVESLLAAGFVGAPITRRKPERLLQFYLRRHTAAQLSTLTFRTTLTTESSRLPSVEERPLIDPMHLDPAGETVLDAWSVSQDGDLVAYQVSKSGSEDGVLRVLDVSTGQDLDGSIYGVRYSPVAWLPRSSGMVGFYYVRQPPTGSVPVDEQRYHRRVYLHIVGQHSDNDIEVFGSDRSMTSSYGVDVSHDGRWLTISAADGSAPRRDIWLADLWESSAARPRLRPVAVGLDAAHRVWVGPDGRLYVHTNLDAPRGRLCVAETSKPSPEFWGDLIPEERDAVLTDFAVLDHDDLPEPLLLVARRRHATAALAVHRLQDGAHVADINLPGVGCVGPLVSAPDQRDSAWFTYVDYTRPGRVLTLDARTLLVSTWAEAPGTPPTGSDVRAQEVAFTSHDGTTVRMVVLAHTELTSHNDSPHEPRPTVLRGYGGFGVSMTPRFSASALAWVRAGGVWAVAHLRGGGEEGREWHLDGTRDRKNNVFDDFHAASLWLVEQGWTTPDQLAISGESNGGLLVGVAITRHPELYAAAFCAAPLLDMVRYELHGLGALWSEEYGTAKDPDELDWLLSYSPYHRIRTGVAYPAVLFAVFDSDGRVDPLHARKTAAALQHATSSGVPRRPVLLRREANVGHGNRSRTRMAGLLTDNLLFLAHHTGLQWPDTLSNIASAKEDSA